MGAGKSTLLKEIENSQLFFGYSYYDLDSEIEKKNNISSGSLGELISMNGWEWFRREESLVLSELLSLKNIWIALGGGSLTEKNLAIIESYKNLKGYWLATSFEDCYRRIKADSNRPLVTLSTDELKSLYLEREEIYQKFEKIGAQSIKPS